MISTIVGILVLGLVAGFIARAIVPGRQAIGIGPTIAVGVVGSLLGGLLGYLIFNKDHSQGALQPAGWIGSIIGAVIVLLAYMRFGPGKSISR